MKSSVGHQEKREGSIYREHCGGSGSCRSNGSSQLSAEQIISNGSRLIPRPYIETPLWLGPVDNSWFSIGWKHTTSYPLAFHLFSNPEGNQRVLSLLIYLSIVTLLDFNVILCQMLLKLLISIKSLTANCKSGRSWFWIFNFCSHCFKLICPRMFRLPAWQYRSALAGVDISPASC